MKSKMPIETRNLTAASRTSPMPDKGCLENDTLDAGEFTLQEIEEEMKEQTEDTNIFAELMGLKLLPRASKLRAIQRKMEENAHLSASENESDDDNVRDKNYEPAAEDTSPKSDSEEESESENIRRSQIPESEIPEDNLSEYLMNERANEIIAKTRENQISLEKEGRAFEKTIVKLGEKHEKESFGESFQMPYRKVINTSKSGKKKYACYLCLRDKALKEPKDRKRPKLYVEKIVVHLQRMHSNEEEVIALRALPTSFRIKKQSLSHAQNLRVRLIKLIHDKGSYEYNKSTSLDKNGPMIMTRRARETTNADNPALLAHYRPCPGCKEFYKKSSIKKHMVTCIEGVKHDRTHSYCYQELLADFIHPEANEYLKRAYLVLNKDILGSIARRAFVIIFFGNDNAIRFSCNEKNYIQIRSDARMLPKILLKMIEQEKKWK